MSLQTLSIFVSSIFMSMRVCLWLLMRFVVVVATLSFAAEGFSFPLYGTGVGNAFLYCHQFLEADILSYAIYL